MKYKIFKIGIRDRAIALLPLENDLRRAVENQELQLRCQHLIAQINQILTETGLDARSLQKDIYFLSP